MGCDPPNPDAGAAGLAAGWADTAGTGADVIAGAGGTAVGGGEKLGREAGAIGGAAGRSPNTGGIAGCAGTPASFDSGVAGRDDAGVGLCANGAGCAPIVGRGAATFVDGRTKGVGNAPGPWVGRDGVVGTPPGWVGRTGDEDPTALVPAAGVGSLRAGVGSGAAGADERSAGLGALDMGGVAVGATGAAESGVAITGVGRGGVAGRIGDAIAGVGRAGGGGGASGAIAGVDCAGVAGMIGGAIGGSTRAAAIVGVGVTTGGAENAGVRDPTGVGADATADDVAGVLVAANSSPLRSPAVIEMTAPQTEHRARTFDAGIRVGSTRNTERHSWQTTFMPNLPRERRALVRRCA